MLGDTGFPLDLRPLYMFRPIDVDFGSPASSSAVALTPYVSPSGSNLTTMLSHSWSTLYSDAAIESCEYIKYCFNY